MATFKKLVAEAKRMKKRHPKKHKMFSAYVKDASKKLSRPKRKKRVVSSVGKVRKKRSVSKRRPKTVVKVRRVVRTKYKVRRVGAVKKGMSTGTILMLVGGGLLLWSMLKKKEPTTVEQQKVQQFAPLIRQTNNPARNSTADDVLKYAIAVGMASDAILRLINNMNSSTDSELESLRDSIDSSGDIPSNWV